MGSPAVCAVGKDGDTLFSQPGSKRLIPENRYLFRAPLLDPKQHVIGYRLAWQKNGPGSDISHAADSQQLLAFVAGHVDDIKSGLFFLDVSPALLSAQVLQTLSPENTVLVLGRDGLLDAVDVDSAKSLHQRGFVLALRDADLAFLKANEAPLSCLTYVLVGAGHPDLTEISKFARHRRPPFCVVADKIPDWQAFDACASLGVCGVFENLCLAPHAMSPSVKLGPQARQILQLMQMVQGDADIRNLEKVLKSDVALAYKLLRYINSAGFGLQVEIESPRHAVAMLGYSPLFRWLLLLLARTNSTFFSPALMQAAMARGRFAELLGQGFLSRKEADNLFVVGMFSFLDHLLGIPIQEVLSQLVLPEPVVQALRSREGVYGQVLALAEASEREGGGAADFAEALSMTATQVNQAHLAALAWVQNIKL